MTLVVDCEFAPDLFVNLDHRAGECVDARPATPDGMLGQLPVDDGEQVGTVDELKLIVARVASLKKIFQVLHVARTSKNN